MKKKIGVWVDKERAVFISLNEKKQPDYLSQLQLGKRRGKMPKELHEVQAILSSTIQTKLRIPGDTKEFSRWGAQHYSTELKNEHKLKNEKKRYFRNILLGIKDVDEVVLFGPAYIKKELESQIERDSKLHAHILDVKSAHNMSERQMVRWVENYFNSTGYSQKKIMRA